MAESNGEFRIRGVRESDAARLVEIYSHYVLNTAVSFEYEVPSVEEFINRIRHTTESYPYLVCENNDRVIGYAYAGAYSSRKAYDWTVTTSIYVDKEYRRQGIGSLLYDALEEKLKEQEDVLFTKTDVDMEDEEELSIAGSFQTKDDGDDDEKPFTALANLINEK